MLSQLNLSYFLAHAESTITFTPGVNVICPEYGVWPHSLGKTSIIRALDFVLRNNGTLEDVLMHDAKEVSVVAIMDDGRKVERIRSKQLNRYVVDGQVIDSPGSSVPEVVESLTGIMPVPVGQREEANVQFAEPWSPRFLVGYTGPARAALVASLGGAEQIRPAMQAADKEANRLIRELDTNNKRASEVEEEIGLLDWIEKSQAELEKLRKLQDDIAKQRQEIERARELNNQRRPYEGFVSRLGDLHTTAQDIKQTIAGIQEVRTDIQAIKNAKQKHTDAEQGIGRVEQAIANAEVQKNNAKEKLNSVLEEMGHCPYCGATEGFGIE